MAQELSSDGSALVIPKDLRRGASDETTMALRTWRNGAQCQ